MCNEDRFTTILQWLAVIVMLFVISVIIFMFFYHVNQKCIEYEEVPSMECYYWNERYSTCEERIQMRCVRYDD